MDPQKNPSRTTGRTSWNSATSRPSRGSLNRCLRYVLDQQLLPQQRSVSWSRGRGRVVHGSSVGEALAAACAALLLQAGLRRRVVRSCLRIRGGFRRGAASPRGPLPGGCREAFAVLQYAVADCLEIGDGDCLRIVGGDSHRTRHAARSLGAGSRPRLPLRWGTSRSWCCVSTSPGCGACLPAADFSCVVLRNLLHYGCSAAARPYPTRLRRTAATREDRFWNRGQS